MSKLSIVLISDSKERELNYLRHLKKVLISELNADVTIIGSLSEIQRIYYLLSNLQPQVVIMSQVFEQSCQDLAQYVRNSCSQLVIIPCELRVSLAYKLLVENKSISLNDHLDWIFLPGDRLKVLFDKTNIEKRKMFITGSPKIDIGILQAKNSQLSKKKFCSINKIRARNKNVFFFTSFIQTSLDFLRQDKLYSNQMQYNIEFNKEVAVVSSIYESEILYFANHHPELNIVIKPHPLEKTNYRKLKQQAKNNNVYIIWGAIENFYRSIDLAVHWLSTVALECWINGIPVIEFFPGKYDELLQDFKSGHPVVRSAAELEKAIKKYLQQKLESKYLEVQKKYLKDVFFKTDGKSAYRIAKLLKQKLPTKITPHFSRRTSVTFTLFVWLEKAFGQVIPRRILSYIDRSYQVEYAINNLVFE